MKKLVVLIAACVASTAAHAELVTKKGAKATLKVEYVFTSKGDYFSPSKDQKRKWEIRRAVQMNATYVADAPQPFGMMHANDPSQQRRVKEQEAKANALAGQMQPMMSDMMKIDADCKHDEKCIEAKVTAYANNMGKPTDVAQKQAAIDDLAHPGGPQYQLWRSTSQSGEYRISEISTFQVYEMTCTEAKACKRTVTTRGSGAIPDPPGRSVAGASMFEVDGSKRDLVLLLPVPLQPLPTETLVESSIANDSIKSSKGFAKPMLVKVEPITVTFKSDRVEASGSKTIPIPGNFEEGGMLTISWSLTTQ